MELEKNAKEPKSSKTFQEFFKGVSSEEKTRKTEKKWSLYFILFVSGIWSIIASVVLWILYFQSEFHFFQKLKSAVIYEKTVLCKYLETRFKESLSTWSLW